MQNICSLVLISYGRDGKLQNVQFLTILYRVHHHTSAGFSISKTPLLLWKVWKIPAVQIFHEITLLKWHQSQFWWWLQSFLTFWYFFSRKLQRECNLCIDIFWHFFSWTLFEIGAGAGVTFVLTSKGRRGRYSGSQFSSLQFPSTDMTIGYCQ